MVGQRVGSWILEQELGRGGMGAVYKARHFSLNIEAAVKVVSPGLESEEGFRQRFQREAKLQAQLSHPNVARVLDYLEHNGHWFLIIEYLQRGSLADLLRRGELVTRQQAMTWTRQALSGLNHAHERGIVHRDVKPANLMFNARSEVVVVDFGIAREDAALGLTSTGATVGTPAYMSPEQILTPNQIDGRADLYSLGIVLYELLAHRRPFMADSEFSILQAHITQAPPSLRSIDPSVPPELDAVVVRALAKRPEERYPNGEAFARALELVQTSVANPEQPPSDPNGSSTIHQSRFYERASFVPDAPSPAEVREQKRKAFRRRSVLASIGTLTVVTVLAIRQGDVRSIWDRTGSIPTSTARSDATVTRTARANDSASAIETSTQSAITKPQIPTQKQAVLPPNLIPSAPVNHTPSSHGPPPTGAIAAPPPALPALPERPRIAVVGTGSDTVMAGALEQEMERRLDLYDVADEHGDPAVDELLSSKDVTAKALGAQLLANGFHILVVVRVEEGDRRTMDVRGQSLSMKAARLRLTAYLLPVNHIIGSGWTEGVEYSEMSASAKARQAFIGATVDLRQAIDNDWAQLRASRSQAGGDR